MGLFTATIGLVFLFAVPGGGELVAGRHQSSPHGVVGLLLVFVQFIGYSYRAANDPNSNFFLSLMGFTLGVGLCEEICKALPLLFIYRRPNGQSWRVANLLGPSSGAGNGLAGGVIYAGGFYNGISGAGIYFVRNLSCVALHALWTGSAAITIHQRQRWFQEEMRWYDWIVRAIAVVAVPMVLHGLYDTLLKKKPRTPWHGGCGGSAFFAAFQISRLRGVNDQTACGENAARIPAAAGGDAGAVAGRRAGLMRLKMEGRLPVDYLYHPDGEGAASRTRSCGASHPLSDTSSSTKSAVTDWSRRSTGNCLLFPPRR